MEVSHSRFSLLFFGVMSLALALSIMTPAFAAEPTVSGERVAISQASAEIYKQLGSIEKDIAYIKDNMKQIKSTADEAQKDSKTSNYSLITLVTIASIFSIIFFNFLKRTMRHNLNTFSQSFSEETFRKLSAEQDAYLKTVQTNVEQVANEIISRAEEKHFKFTHITTLRYSKLYDEALIFAEWSGDFAKYANEPQPIQRALIMCLANSRKARKDDSHLIAWKWSRHLLDAEVNGDNMLTVLRTGNSLKQWPESIDIYDDIEDKLSYEDKEKCEPLLFVALRRSRNKDNYKEYTLRLRKLAEKHQDTKDVLFTTNLAAFFRDDGKFEDAEKIMVSKVQRLTGVSSVKHEEGWDRLFNTYIANCIDQGKPENAIQQAKTMIANSSDTNHVFTCTRLAWYLDTSNNEHDKSLLFKVINNRYESSLLPEKDDGAIKTIAILKEVADDRSGSEAILRQSIDECKGKEDRWSKYHHYYYVCMLSEIYMSRRDETNINAAISILSPLVASDKIGEAQYLIAKAYALSRNVESMEKHLEMASKDKRKWIIKASYDPILRSFPQVEQLTSKYAFLGEF